MFVTHVFICSLMYVLLCTVPVGEINVDHIHVYYCPTEYITYV